MLRLNYLPTTHFECLTVSCPYHFSGSCVWQHVVKYNFAVVFRVFYVNMLFSCQAYPRMWWHCHEFC